MEQEKTVCFTLWPEREVMAGGRITWWMGFTDYSELSGYQHKDRSLRL